MHFTCKTDLVGPFEPTWIDHRWHYLGRQYRSLRTLKSQYGYKIEAYAAKTLINEIRKEIDAEVLNTIMGSYGNI